MHHWCLSLFACLLFISHFGFNDADDSDMVMHKVFAGKSASIAEYQRKMASYWTAERRQAAKPMKVRTLSSKKNQTGRQAQHVIDKEAEAATIIEPRLPSHTGNRTQLKDALFQPTVTAGIVFFTSGLYNYQCSGSVVNSPSQNLVITAAHCVYDVDSDEWSTNFIFIPAYNLGDQPYGLWTARTLHAVKGYTEAVNFDFAVNYDVGFAVMLPSNGRRIGEVVGSNGIGFNLPRTDMSYAFGYPGNIAYGEIMSACMGKLLSENCGDPGFFGQSRQCGMGGGSSGGPWMQNFNDRTGLGTITSVTSFSCPGYTPYVLYGPAFNNDIKKLYTSVRSLI